MMVRRFLLYCYNNMNGYGQLSKKLAKSPI